MRGLQEQCLPDKGALVCFDRTTGKLLRQENLGKQYPSPVLANGLVYLPNDEGVITVIKSGRVFERN